MTHHPKFPDYLSRDQRESGHLNEREKRLINALWHLTHWHDQLRPHDIEMATGVIDDTLVRDTPAMKGFLEFENGSLVKVDGMRPEYMDGYQLIVLVQRLGRELHEARSNAQTDANK